VLKVLVGDDEAMIREFLHDFPISAEKIATELRAACTQGNTATVGAAANKLRPSIRSVGALALGAELDALLTPLRGGNMAAVCNYLFRFPSLGITEE